MKKHLEKYFRGVYEQYWDSVFRLSMGYVNDRAWAKDITQEVFMIVWEQLPTFRKEAKVSTWIYRITVNLCLRQLKSSEKIVNKEAALLEKERVEEPYQEVDTGKLYAAIATLSEVNRLIISMVLEGVDQKEISNVMGLSYGSVRVRVSRIKEELFKIINK